MQDHNANPLLSSSLPPRGGAGESANIRRWYRSENAWNCQDAALPAQPRGLRVFRARR